MPETEPHCDLVLLPTSRDDWETLFELQNDADAHWQAAFTPRRHDDRRAYMESMARNSSRPNTLTRTMWLDGAIIGWCAVFPLMEDEMDVGYWLRRSVWGRGLATRALALLLKETDYRPLHARAAFDNYASQRVLQKCGFREIGRGMYNSICRGGEVEEVIYRLDESTSLSTQEESLSVT